MSIIEMENTSLLHKLSSNKVIQETIPGLCLCDLNLIASQPTIEVSI